MNKKIIIVTMIFLISIISLFIYHGKNNKKINIYDTVKETFLTDKGYSNEMSKHVSEKVFKSTNLYTTFNLNDTQYNKPVKIDFKLKEKAQNKKKDLILVEMIYSAKITDSQNNIIGEASDVPVTFIVKNQNGNWYIVSKEVKA
ncbi:hypothetical protein ACTQ4K_04235 [Clostridium sporogenes]|uniref:hypothetical protein n=1 Tax=Clostridium sporogenes TaxID=1509 RepID=UPI003F901715